MIRVMSGAQTSIPLYSEARRTGPGVALQINHAHPELELNLVVSGKGTYFLEDGQYDLTAGALVWLLPNQAHRLIRSPDLDMWVVTVAPADIDAEILGDVAKRPCRILATPDAVALDRLLSHLSQDADEPQLYRAGLDYLIRSAWRATINSPGAARKPVHPAVVQALSILRSNADTPTSTQLAKKCGVTQDYLGQLLVKHTGRGFVDWRNRTRLERFHVLYPRNGDLLNAALDAGFGSYTQFHRVFCDLVGTTPGEWAKSGAQTKSVALPSSFSEITGSSAESPRMLWYSLSEIVFPAAMRWFTPAFGHNFGRAMSSLEEGSKIETGVQSFAELRPFANHLIEQVRGSDSERAGKMVRALHRNDVFEGYHRTIGHYGVDPSDMTRLVGIYLALATAAATSAPTPSFEKIEAIHARTRRAMTMSASMQQATREERQRAAAAIVATTAFLRCAMVGARASGNDEIAIQVADAASATALGTLGLDVRAFAADEASIREQALAS
jgi:AraC-like DNA-binding protein